MLGLPDLPYPLTNLRTHRNWRYHKNLRVWLTKDAQFADPQPISNEAERGRYVVFNEKVWQRESVSRASNPCQLTTSNNSTEGYDHSLG
jgi:hypothetical protein